MSAVLDFPASGRHATLVHPPHLAFLAELRRLNVDCVAGESIDWLPPYPMRSRPSSVNSLRLA